MSYTYNIGLVVYSWAKSGAILEVLEAYQFITRNNVDS